MTARLTPTAVIGLESGVTAIAAATRTPAHLGASSILLCWGLNEAGQVGDSTTTNRSIPTAVSSIAGEWTRCGGIGSHLRALRNWRHCVLGMERRRPTRRRDDCASIHSDGVSELTTGASAVFDGVLSHLRGGSRRRGLLGYNSNGQLGDGRRRLA